MELAETLGGLVAIFLVIVVLIIKEARELLLVLTSVLGAAYCLLKFLKYVVDTMQ